jgi:hypothetical protein
MAKIISSRIRIEELIQLFGNENNSFLRKQYYSSNQEAHWILDFVLNGKDCSIDIYYKEKEINILPRGKNKETSNILIDFLEQNSYSPEVKTVSISIPNVYKSFFEDFNRYLNEYSQLNITVHVKDNRKVYETENGDRVYFQKYNNGTILVQTRPFKVFNHLMDFLSENKLIKTEEIIEWSKQVIGINYSTEIYIDELKRKLGDAYVYFPEAIQKTLVSSYAICKSNILLQDYSVAMAGVFRALEAYIKMILEKYGYKLKRRDTFGMFHSEYTEDIKLIDNINIPSKVKIDLINLHKLYNNKRNVYLHVPLNTMSTPIIENSSDMIDIVYEILDSIKSSYDRIKNEG